MLNMKRLSRLTFIFSVIIAVSVSVLGQSQATTGVIQGTVTDPNGAVLAGASITVKNVNTGFERTVSTNSDGFYSAPLLPLGKYRVTASANGFSTTILENVEVT
ncbi:carboxypeptidase-like regulatory domain-containing protein, partial [Escherichia coli]|nr:carboxypeptidase-like regulatory domain-containing protein [Escherichia coli]